MSNVDVKTGSLILNQTRVDVHADEFAMVSVAKDRWPELLANESAGPGGEAPFLIFSDPFEVTLVLNGRDLDAVRSAFDDVKVERGFRLLTFATAMDFTVVGFIAEVTRILADASIPVIVVSSFSRDHLLVKQNHLAAALKALGAHMSELC